MSIGGIRAVVGRNSGLPDDDRDLRFESEGRCISISRHQGPVGSQLKNGNNSLRSRTDSTSRPPNFIFEFQVMVHPELQIFLILRIRPFSKLFKRNCRSPAISLEQIKHRLRLLQSKLRVTLGIGSVHLQGVPPPLSAAQSCASTSKAFSGSA
jgi:hypothetical protein